MKVFIFDEAGKRLATCDGWEEAEVKVRTLQEQGHNALMAKDYEKETHTPATSGRQIPLRYYGPWTEKALIGPTYLRRDERGRE